MEKNAQFVYENPAYIATQIKAIIDIMLYKMSLDSRNRAYPNIKGRIKDMNVYDMAAKKSHGGSSIGVSISLIKNMMNGKSPSFIHQTHLAN